MRQKNVSKSKRYEVVVVGAGVFGAWTALQLARRGQRVLLVDAYGAGNSRASSGGESRIIRMGYGANEIYTRWSQRSLALWTDAFTQANRPELFEQTGVLWPPPAGDPSAAHTRAAFEKHGVPFQSLAHSEL